MLEHRSGRDVATHAALGPNAQVGMGTEPSAASFPTRWLDMRTRALCMLTMLTLAACEDNSLKAPTLILAPARDIDAVEAALEQYRPLIGVSVQVTTDAKRWATWRTEERWQLRDAASGDQVMGESACVDWIASTDRNTKTVWIGDCDETQGDARAYVEAHELGHLVGADDTWTDEDCEGGVMRGKGVPQTLEPNEETKQELRTLYE